ncbi:LacI family DNA-binding transcriptional regulator [Agromyces sp. NPDC049794]|uniref:LacI family DNA-binding transcriptional regulator n=1 Tax=unclassified Agromyces TaxID=2639701 RepID=UPI003407AFFD
MRDAIGDRIPRPRVTLADVAREAGCSAAAVSLWVNGKSSGRLSVENAERIEHAVVRLGYVPNRTAQRLALGSSQSVAFLFPGAAYGNFFTTIVDGVADRLGPEWEITFVDAKLSASAASSAPLARALRSDPSGLLVSAPSPDILAALEDVCVPTVVIDAPSAPAHVSLVTLDLTPSIHALVQHLDELGHRRVAYVSYVAESLSLSSRRSQVRDQLLRRGIDMVDQDLLLDSLTLTHAAQAFTGIWPAWERAGVTAVICADDRHAYGVMAAGRELGIDLPGRLSLVGFNDLDPNALLSPALSAIALPALEMGTAAADAFAAHLSTGTPSRLMIPTRYIRRESTGPRR